MTNHLCNLNLLDVHDQNRLNQYFIVSFHQITHLNKNNQETQLTHQVINEKITHLFEFLIVFDSCLSSIKNDYHISNSSDICDLFSSIIDELEIIVAPTETIDKKSLTNQQRVQILITKLIQSPTVDEHPDHSDQPNTIKIKQDIINCPKLKLKLESLVELYECSQTVKKWKDVYELEELSPLHEDKFFEQCLLKEIYRVLIQWGKSETTIDKVQKPLQPKEIALIFCQVQKYFLWEKDFMPLLLFMAKCLRSVQGFFHDDWSTMYHYYCETYTSYFIQMQNLFTVPQTVLDHINSLIEKPESSDQSVGFDYYYIQFVNQNENNQRELILFDVEMNKTELFHQLAKKLSIHGIFILDGSFVKNQILIKTSQLGCDLLDIIKENLIDMDIVYSNINIFVHDAKTDQEIQKPTHIIKFDSTQKHTDIHTDILGLFLNFVNRYQKILSFDSFPHINLISVDVQRKEFLISLRTRLNNLVELESIVIQLFTKINLIDGDQLFFTRDKLISVFVFTPDLLKKNVSYKIVEFQ